MSCLTRKLQQQLTRYLQRNNPSLAICDPEKVRLELVSKGVCPSAVTTDQVRLMLEVVKSC